jgi:hypothetical protein
VRLQVEKQASLNDVGEGTLLFRFDKLVHHLATDLQYPSLYFLLQPRTVLCTIFAHLHEQLD